MQFIIKSIKDLEGFESIPYADPITKKEPYTFGFGFTDITQEEAEYILNKRAIEITAELMETFSWFENLSDLRKMVIFNMRYQMGMPRLKKFKNTLRFISLGKFTDASVEMLDSSWYRQMHQLDMTDGKDEENRAEWLAWIMKHNEYRERRV